MGLAFSQNVKMDCRHFCLRFNFGHVYHLPLIMQSIPPLTGRLVLAPMLSFYFQLHVSVKVCFVMMQLNNDMSVESLGLENDWEEMRHETET